MASKYFECVWYRHPLKAASKALAVSTQTAESMFVIHDRQINMFGVGVGMDEPAWCKTSDELFFICVINPKIH